MIVSAADRYRFGDGSSAGINAAISASQDNAGGAPWAESIAIGLITGGLTWFVWRFLDRTIATGGLK